MLHHFMQDLLPIVTLPILIFASAWLLGLIVAAFRERAHLRAQTDFLNRMMDKYSSAAELTAYLQSEAGKRFFENSATGAISPLNKILGSIQKGAILTLLGSGLFVLGNKYTAQEGGNIMLVVGTISFMVGLGFLVSSVISYRLAKSLGIISDAKTVGSSRQSSEL